jgi:hypothetical protein
MASILRTPGQRRDGGETVSRRRLVKRRLIERCHPDRVLEIQIGAESNQRGQRRGLLLDDGEALRRSNCRCAG